MPKSEPAMEFDVAIARDLFLRIRGGEQAAWNRLTDQYNGLLWSIARGMRLTHADAADVVQGTWLRLVESLDSIRRPERVGSWLATTARRESLAVLRRNDRERIAAVDDGPEIADTGAELDEALLREERDAHLWRAFGQLKPACQRLLRILMSDPRPTYVEVSSALGIPVGSIGPNRQRCIEFLRKIMTSGWDTAPSLGE